MCSPLKTTFISDGGVLKQCNKMINAALKWVLFFFKNEKIKYSAILNTFYSSFLTEKL
jgi:hypothetical protein